MATKFHSSIMAHFEQAFPFVNFSQPGPIGYSYWIRRKCNYSTCLLKDINLKPLMHRTDNAQSWISCPNPEGMPCIRNNQLLSWLNKKCWPYCFNDCKNDCTHWTFRIDNWFDIFFSGHFLQVFRALALMVGRPRSTQVTTQALRSGSLAETRASADSLALLSSVKQQLIWKILAESARSAARSAHIS